MCGRYGTIMNGCRCGLEKDVHGTGEASASDG